MSHALTVVGRFVVRMWCDETGQPSTGRVVLTFTTPVYWAFLWRALTASGDVAIEAVFGGTAAYITVCLWVAALKLGAGVFVPLAEAVAGVFTRAFRGAREMVYGGMRRYGGGPDRSVGLLDPGGELYHEAPPGDHRQPDPYRDDETGEGP